MGKLTVKQIDALKPAGKRLMLADGDGLWLCVRPTGSKSWISRTKKAGVMREKALGVYPEVSLAEARRLHQEQSDSIKTGKLDSLMMFAVAFDKWLVHYARTPSVRTRRIPTEKTIWKQGYRKRLYLSKLDALHVQEITRAKIITILDEMSATPEEARQCFNMLRVFFEWAQLRGIVDHSPLAGVRASSIGITPSRPAGRVLTLEELKLVYDMASGMGGQALRAIILTGSRGGEIAGMEWSEIAGDWWEIPAERMKSRKAHSVYIKPCMAFISDLSGFDLRYVFSTSPGKHIVRNSLTTYATRLANSLKIPQFSPHDLRRSAATHWGEHLGVAPHIIERMLSHAPENKLVAVYQRGEFRDEQASAWSRWALLFLGKSDNVCTIPADSSRPQHDSGRESTSRLKLVK